MKVYLFLLLSLLITVTSYGSSVKEKVSQLSESQKAFFKAVHNGNIELVQQYIKAKNNINIQDEGGSTPLMWAINHKYDEIVKVILQAKADVNRVNEDSESAFKWALATDNKKIMKLLLDAGAPAEAFFLLMKACSEYNLEAVKRLYAAGVSVRKRDAQGRTPLLVAAAKGYDNIISFLIKSGAQVNSRDAKGNSVLMLACKSKCVNAVQALLEGRADVNAVNQNKNTALTIATAYNNSAMVDLLLKAKVNVHVADCGQEALNWADQCDFKEIAGMLINALGKNNFVSALTPLMQAALWGDMQKVKELAPKAPELDVQDRDGDTALILAAREGYTHIVELLLKAGADVTKTNNSGWNALSLAKYRSRTDIVKLLQKEKL